jgi:hypothetical protein
MRKIFFLEYTWDREFYLIILLGYDKEGLYYHIPW